VRVWDLTKTSSFPTNSTKESHRDRQGNSVDNDELVKK